jgi:hypothetical protein
MPITLVRKDFFFLFVCLTKPSLPIILLYY